jgi:lysine 6-dehydrogenase
MGYRFAVIGAGRQGIAAAYDMARHGQAERVLLVDASADTARRASDLVNRLAGRDVAVPVHADAADSERLQPLLEGVTAILGAADYRLNPGLTDIAIGGGMHFCDLGGNTEVVWKQRDRDAAARQAGVAVVPDCGMGPGMNISLAAYAMSLVERPREVLIWDGGLPRHPEPPWNYVSTFSLEGLSNEYYGTAYFLRDGEITEVPCFEGMEELEFPPPLGRLEAAVTSGGLSTAPWTFRGTLQRLENKTLRYPGHWAKFKAFADLGLLDEQPICAGTREVVPRDVFHALLAPRIGASGEVVEDICVIRTKCVGELDGRPAEARIELIDSYDPSTGFTAMQRLTGWHASIVAILAAEGRVQPGVTPVEVAVSGAEIVHEARRRGFAIDEKLIRL